MNPTRQILVKQAGFFNNILKPQSLIPGGNKIPPGTSTGIPPKPTFKSGLLQGGGKAFGQMAAGLALTGATAFASHLGRKVANKNSLRVIQDLINMFSNLHPEWDRKDLEHQLYLLYETKPDLFKYKEIHSIEVYLKSMMDYGGASPMFLKTVTETYDRTKKPGSSSFLKP